jgi:hypothetical protein
VTQTADGLVLENFVTRTEAEGTTTTGTLDRVTMTEMADGSVSVEMSNPYTATIMFPEDVGGPMITLEILVNHEGLGITASGTADARTYVYSADVITVSEGNIGNDRGDPPPTIDMEIIARDLATTYLISGPPTQEQRFESSRQRRVRGRAFRRASAPGRGRSPEGELRPGRDDSTRRERSWRWPRCSRRRTACPKGSRSTARPTYDWSRFEMSFEAPATFQRLLRNDGGNFGIALSNEELRYDISASGMETRVSGATFPSRSR